MKDQKFIFLTGLLFLVNLLHAFPIVQDGKAVSAIVIPERAVKSEQLAAKELQYHVKLITGAELQILTDKDKCTLPMICIGNTKYFPAEKFAEQEYLIQVDPKGIRICGEDEPDYRDFDYAKPSSFPGIWQKRGTLNGVYYFCENLLNFRYYLPGPDGIDFVQTKDLSVPDTKIRRAPFMKMRCIYVYNNIPEDFAGSCNDRIQVKTLDQRECSLFSLRRNIGGKPMAVNHSFYRWKEIYGKTHPEFFAVGRPLGTQLCYCNEALIREVVDRARDFFDGKPDAWQYFYQLKQDASCRDIVPIVPMDNPYFCQCPKCTKLLNEAKGRGKGQYSSDMASEYFFTFAAKVAAELKKSHPDKKVGFLAYGSYAYPPSFALPDNSVIQYCLQARDVFNKRTMDGDREILKQWQEKNGNLTKMLWLYYCYPSLQARQARYEMFPGFFAHHIGPLFRSYAEANARGFFLEPSYSAHSQRNVLADQVEEYITFKMADDPTADADKLINEFFVRYYGKAAVPMKQFYEFVEKTFCSPESYGKELPTRHNEHTAWGVLGTPDRMEHLTKLMDQAVKAAAQDKAIYQRRVEIFRKGIYEKMMNGHREYQKRAKLMGASMQQSFAPCLVNPVPGDPVKANWSKAGRLGVWYGGLHGENVPRDIRGFVTHDGKYLYVKIEDPVNTKTLTNLSDWGDGCEYFFGPNRAEPCYQVGAGHNGQFFFKAYGIDALAKDSIKIVSDCSNSDCFVQYMAVPLEIIGCTPGQMMYLNVLRNQANKNVACWIPTYGGHFAPDRMGEIFLQKVKKP